MPKRVEPDTDSQKIRLIPEMMNAIAEINRILITGDVAAGVPGLLEIIRGIKAAVDKIAQKQCSYEDLERRVRDIEERNKRDEEKKKINNSYTLAVFSIAVSNIVMIVLWLLGFGR